FEDGVNIQPDEFYRRLATTKVMPTTSQVSVPNLQKTFSTLLDQGYDVLGIFVSSKLSGTFQSAVQTRDALPKGREKVEVMDRLVEIIVEQCSGKVPVRLATLHANAHEDAREILENASKILNVTEEIFTEVSPVVGAHAGPGTVGLAYMAGM